MRTSKCWIGAPLTKGRESWRTWPCPRILCSPDSIFLRCLSWSWPRMTRISLSGSGPIPWTWTASWGLYRARAPRPGCTVRLKPGNAIPNPVPLRGREIAGREPNPANLRRWLRSRPGNLGSELAATLEVMPWHNNPIVRLLWSSFGRQPTGGRYAETGLEEEEIADTTGIGRQGRS